MKITLDIKNISKAINPKKGNVVLYDGRDWIVTTKDDILRDVNSLLEDCKSTLLEMKQNKKDVAKQLLEMSELIKKIYSK